MTRALDIALFALLGLALPGCVRALDEERSSIGELERDCLLPVPEGVTGLEAPVSLEYADGSLWTWNSVELDDGRIIETPSAFVPSVDEACSRGPTLSLDDAGDPATLLSLTDEERDENAARTDGRRLALVPTGGFVHEGTGHLYYDHVLFGPGFFDAESLGTGLCLLGPGATSCERIAPDGDTVFFRADERLINRGGLVEGERAILYGCRQVASLTAICTVTGVPLDRVTEPSAYQVWNAFDGWVDDPLAAAVIVDELGPLTVSPYEDGFLGTVIDIFESRVYVRYAEKATDELERRIEVFDLVPPESWFPGGGREHSSLREEPRTMHVSYFTDNTSERGLHLATFRFFGDWQDP